MSVRYPPKQAVIDWLRREIDHAGGSFGIRDEGGLEAALGRAEQLRAYAETEPDIPTLAAAIAFGIVKLHHTFVDGNKRAALGALFMTLQLNGLYLDARESDVVRVLLGLAEGSLSEDEFVVWVGEHTAPA